VAADLTQARTLLPVMFSGVRQLVSCSAVKVQPKEGDADRSKYFQGGLQCAALCLRLWLWLWLWWGLCSWLWLWLWWGPLLSGLEGVGSRVVKKPRLITVAAVVVVVCMLFSNPTPEP